jgi:hypothetical protein
MREECDRKEETEKKERTRQVTIIFSTIWRVSPSKSPSFEFSGSILLQHKHESHTINEKNDKYIPIVTLYLSQDHLQ